MVGIAAGGEQDIPGKRLVEHNPPPPPAWAMTFSIRFMHDLKAEEGGQVEVSCHMVRPILYWFCHRKRQ